MVCPAKEGVNSVQFQARQPSLTDPDFHRRCDALHVPDDVDRTGLDPGRKHATGWGGTLPFDGLDQHCAGLARTRGGEHNMALQIEQNRRGITRLRTPMLAGLEPLHLKDTTLKVDDPLTAKRGCWAHVFTRPTASSCMPEERIVGHARGGLGLQWSRREAGVFTLGT